VLQAAAFQCRFQCGFQPIHLIEQVVDHHMADEKDCAVRLALGQQVVDAALLGNEKVVTDGISHRAVDFFRHGQVATAQARFDKGRFSRMVRTVGG